MPFYFLSSLFAFILPPLPLLYKTFSPEKVFSLLRRIELDQQHEVESCSLSTLHPQPQLLRIQPLALHLQLLAPHHQPRAPLLHKHLNTLQASALHSIQHQHRPNLLGLRLWSQGWRS